MTFLIIGTLFTGWALLLILSTERQRRLFEIEAKRQRALAELQKQQKKQAEIPVIG